MLQYPTEKCRVERLGLILKPRRIGFHDLVAPAGPGHGGEKALRFSDLRIVEFNARNVQLRKMP
ncbi:MAG: hypothetical protein WDM79_03595 [Terricaulis sp.]